MEARFSEGVELRDSKETRRALRRRKKGASDLEAYQIVIVGNRRLIYHGNAPPPTPLPRPLKRRTSPFGIFNYYHSHFYASWNHGYRRGMTGWARFPRSRNRDARRRPGVGHSPLLSTRRLVPLSANT
ncbi:hypothetical protein ALC56_03168 [Trachymyrmex septentrionalis]|uniref:Uncharacterized protein n=1 Tax=Trachymyrmex septentrionalis TaxID=34720 RepID=A0A151JZX4_9HYME|nr:hypothetical protein ALC56_03168 [Trachymyrmex septentrionalis]